MLLLKNIHQSLRMLVIVQHNLEQKLKLRPDQQNGFTKTISELLEKYELALKSGDVTKIAMISALMEKVLAKVKEGKTEEQEKATGKTLGQDISDLLTRI